MKSWGREHETIWFDINTVWLLGEARINDVFVYFRKFKSHHTCHDCVIEKKRRYLDYQPGYRAESQHLAIGWPSIFRSSPWLIQALGHDKEITALICNDTDATDKLSSLKTFLKQSYYQFSHCFWDSDAVISCYMDIGNLSSILQNVLQVLALVK